MPEMTPIESAHRWQGFRERCVELAIKGGATPDTVIKVASEIATYIITKDLLEVKPTVEKSK